MMNVRKAWRMAAVSIIVVSMSGFSLSASAEETSMSGDPIISNLTDATGTTSYDFSQLDSDMNALIDGGQTGSAVLVVKDGNIVHDGSYGYEVKYTQGDDIFNDHQSVLLDQSQWSPVDDDTMWDMASVTKMLATNMALQKLVYEGKLDITQKVSYYIPGFHDYPDVTVALTPEAQAKQHKDKVTVEMVLRHEAGQVPDPQYFNDNYLKSQAAATYLGFNEAGIAYQFLYVSPQSDTLDRTQVLNAINKTPLAAEPGTTVAYSDVDYMLLGMIVEQITGMPLDEYVETTIYQPLGLTHTVFNPLEKGFTPDEFAATEINGNSRDGYRTPSGVNSSEYSFTGMRTYTLRGEVHDEKAYYTMAGVSGHAGLFSTPHDVAVLLQLMLNNGIYNGVRVFDKETVDLFLTPGSMVLSNGYTRTDYALGWYVNDIYYSGTSTGWPSYFSNYASLQTFGHQGWTGPLVYADPMHNLIVVYMRNRPHNPVVGPTSVNTFEHAGTSATTYRTVANDVYQSIGVTNYVSFLPNIGTEKEIITNDFRKNASVKVDVTFLDPLNGKPITKMYERNPRVTRVGIGQAAPEAPHSTSEPPGSAGLIEPSDWLAKDASYFFNATESGDYYISLYTQNNTNFNDAKIVKYVRVVDASSPQVLAPALSVSSPVELKLNETYNPQTGVQAEDEIYGDLTSQVQYSGEVDTSHAGVYVVNYEISNAADKTSTAQRVVVVNDGTYLVTEDFILHATDFTIPQEDLTGSDCEIHDLAHLEAWDSQTGNLVSTSVIDRGGYQGRPGEYPIKVGVASDPMTATTIRATVEATASPAKTPTEESATEESATEESATEESATTAAATELARTGAGVTNIFLLVAALLITAAVLRVLSQRRSNWRTR